MIYRAGTPRRGITLLEVLAAIFIMGVGMLALLTLFPLGALSMARAVRDDRAATFAANAASVAAAFDLRNDPVVVVALASVPPPLPGGATWGPVDPNGPGYPVFVDPYYATLMTPGLINLGANGIPPAGTPGAWRTGASFAATAQSVARWFSFQDEIQFETTGQTVGGGAAIVRPGTYTCGYMLRRPRSSNADLVDLTVVVYSQRNTELPSGETVFPDATIAGTAAGGTKGTNIIVLGYPVTNKPIIRRGSFLYDTTYKGPPAQTFGRVNGYFYRIANVTETSTTTMNLELDTELKEDVTAVVLLDNVIAVIERGTTWKP